MIEVMPPDYAFPLRFERGANPNKNYEMMIDLGMAAARHA